MVRARRVENYTNEPGWLAAIFMPKPIAPCDARVADGAVRGCIVGGLWAGFFGWKELDIVIREASAMNVAVAASRYTAASVLGFGAFFGVYNGVLCASEKACGSDSLVGPVLAGGAMGAAIGAYLPPPRLGNIGGYSLFLALVSAGTANFLK